MGLVCSKLRKTNFQDNIEDFDKSVYGTNSKTIEYKDTIPFVVPLKNGTVVKVYDGDTITIANRLPLHGDNTMYRFSVRLNGIDTPEIKGKDDDEKTAAISARDALSKLILHKEVQLMNVTTEKYGRLLADIYLDKLHINQWLIDERYAVKYDGGHKESPESWLNYKQNAEM